MKRKKRVLWILLLVCLLFFSVDSLTARADFGDSNDYDFGGGYDSGDYDFGGYDSGSSYYSYSSGYGHSYGDGGSGIGGNVVVVIVVLIVVISIIKAYQNQGTAGRSAQRRPISQTGGSRGAQQITLPDRTAQITDLVKQTDPDFVAEDFMAYAKNVFMDMQLAWMNRDLHTIRPLLQENLYDQTQKQVQAKIAQGLINKLERISVHEAYLTSCGKDDNYEYITVFLRAKMVDYQVEEKTGNIVSGDRNTLWELCYRMKFMRKAGSITKEVKEEVATHECPVCGAPLEDGAANVCPYCGSVIQSTRQKWVLCDYGSTKGNGKDEGCKWQ